MGRIKSTIVKRTAQKLVREASDYSENFNENKKFLGNTMPSKKVRNQIAGYIGRLVKRNKPLLETTK